VEGVSGLSAPDCVESYTDSSAVAKLVEDAIELARDWGRICGDGAGSLKDDGGGDEWVDIADVEAAGAASSSSEVLTATAGGCTGNGSSA